MTYRINSAVCAVATPPIADAQAWIANRVFPVDKPLLDLSQAVPSYAPAKQLRAHLAQHIDDPHMSLYTDILGVPALRSALAWDISRDYQCTVAAEQIAITAGCNQAYCIAIDALTVPGDEVLLQVPYFFNHHMWLEMRGLKPTYMPASAGSPALPDIAGARAAITANTRVIVLVSPGNPTGAQYPAALLEQFFDLAKQHDLALLIDETYRDFRTNPGPAHRLFERPDWPDVFVHLYSFSKSYAMTGYRVGALAAHRALVNELEKIIDCETICASRLSQEAALFALENLDQWRRQKADMMRNKVRQIEQGFENADFGYKLVSSGAYFAWLKHPFAGVCAWQVAKRLADQQNILLLPGPMFGPGQEDYLRLAFANLDANRFTELFQRLADDFDHAS